MSTIDLAWESKSNADPIAMGNWMDARGYSNLTGSYNDIVNVPGPFSDYKIWGKTVPVRYRRGDKNSYINSNNGGQNIAYNLPGSETSVYADDYYSSSTKGHNFAATFTFNNKYYPRMIGMDFMMKTYNNNRCKWQIASMFGFYRDASTGNKFAAEWTPRTNAWGNNPHRFHQMPEATYGQITSAGKWKESQTCSGWQTIRVQSDLSTAIGSASCNGFVIIYTLGTEGASKTKQGPTLRHFQPRTAGTSGNKGTVVWKVNSSYSHSARQTVSMR
jgi:hypothetical protein